MDAELFGLVETVTHGDMLLGRNDDDNCESRALAAQFALRRAALMKERPVTIVHRRDLLVFAFAGTGAVAAGLVVAEPVAAKSVDLKDKRRARYQANSTEIRNFYRVNSYPTR
jgi:hypothetical protein